MRDLMTGTWYWNPEASAYTDYGSCRPIPQGELLTMVTPYHIDYPMLTIYLRQAVGEKGWAKFTERFGIPPVILTMPSDIPSDQVEMWRAQAEKVAEGGSGAVPAGTQVNFCDGARGINPFKDFIHNQRELTVLMATGGLLTSLAQSGSGTLAGGAHSDTWAEVRRMDSAKIASALNAQIVRPLLARAFPGKAQLVYFDFDTEATPSPGEVFEDAAKARSAGYLIDQAELEEKTGYKLVRDVQGNGEQGMGLSLNKESGVRSQALGVKTNPSVLTPNTSVLAAFSKDSSPAAEAIKELLNDPSKEKAEEILKKLPELLPEDPAMAAVIAEAMAAEFGKMGNGEREPGNGEELKNTQCRAQNPATCRTHGTPIKKIRSVKSSPAANSQAQACGYKDVPDMMAKAENVEQPTIDKISQGFSGKCKAHEAIAVISANAPFNDAEGNSVKFGDDILEHYIEGRRRRDNTPKISNLEDLPFAIKAVKTDTYGVTRLKYPRGTTPDPLNPPRGTQREYHLPTDRGQMKVFVYIQGGKINGWHVKE